MAIDRAWEDVRAFHLAFGAPAPLAPTALERDRVMGRAGWIEEEAQELREATSIAEQADAFIDVIYFALGGLVEMGIAPGRLWEIVQGANMAKLWPDGRPRYREGDGKVIKPEGWQDPGEKLAAEILRQIEDAEDAERLRASMYR